MNIYFTGQITEASSLGWAPGTWPEVAKISSHFYERTDPAMRDGELLYFDYRSLNDAADIVRVIND